MTDTVRVKIADLAVIRDGGVLITVGLGSCVGIALYDPFARVGGLAHILLSDSAMFRNQSNPAKFADTAVPLLIEDMAGLGAKKSRLKAKIAGGSQLFSFENRVLSVGEKNIQAVRNVLAGHNVPIMGEDVGGSIGRTLKLHVADGRVTVSCVGAPEREI